MLEDPLLFTPGPVTTPLQVLLASSKRTISHRTRDFRIIFEETINLLKKIYFTENDVYLLTASGTGGVEAALTNILSRKDKVIIPIYGSFSERASLIAEKIGATVIKKRFVKPSFDDFKELIDNNEDSKALVIVYNDTSPGITIRQLENIANYAKEKNLLVVVDAVSILGGDTLLTDDWKLDIVVSATQKCLMTPPGFATISVSEDAWKVIEKNETSSYYFDLLLYRKFYNERKETPFTPAVNLIYSLNTSLNIICEKIGIKEWIKWHQERARILYSAIEKLGFKPVFEEKYRSNTVLSFYPPQDTTPQYIVKELEERYKIYISRGMGEWRDKIIRVGNMGAIYKRELLILLSALYTILEDKRSIDFSNISAEVEKIKDPLLNNF